MLTLLFEWIENTSIAATVGQSLLLTGLVSAVHVLGMTLVAGGAAVSWLQLAGVLLPERPVEEITRAAEKGMLAGLGVSLASGLLLFAPRASSAAANSVFQWKMLLLLAAAVFHVTLFRTVTRRDRSMTWTLRLAGALGPTLWIGVAVAGAAFILFE